MSEGASLDTFGSFAQALFTLGKLSELQGKINAAVKSSKVPWVESRKLLKCSTVAEATNTPLFQYMKMLFNQIGLGELSISDISKFKLSFALEECPVCKLFPNIEDKKTCLITADAISQFFLKDIDVQNKTVETKCRNDGDDECEFVVEMQPLGYYQIVIDDISSGLLTALADRQMEAHSNREEFVIKLGLELGLDDEDALFRATELRDFMLLDDQLEVTKIGETYTRYLKSSLRRTETKFDPPWLSLREITKTIADSASFAKAFSKSAEGTIETKGKDVVNVAHEGKKSKSFAELLSKHSNNEGTND